MAELRLYRDNYADFTVVSNLFIDQYMKDANDAQLKVYLYLIRMLGAGQSTSVSDIADKFNHTEKDVLRSLKYWEKQGILTLEYEQGKTLAGIRLNSLQKSGEFSASPAVSAVPAESELSLRAAIAAPSELKTSELSPSIKASIQPESASAFKNTAQQTGAAALTASSSVFTQPAAGTPLSASVIYAAPGAGTAAVSDASIFVKPAYTPDQLRDFRSRENTAQLLFIAEQYIGKPLTPAEMKTILFFTDELHFSDDLIDYLLQYCVDRGKKDFKYIEKVAVNWAQEGITTPKQAQQSSGKYEKYVYTIMNELGKSGSPTGTEMEFINRWTKEYGFDTNIILIACQRTVLSTDKHRFEYAEGILKSWKDANVHHEADILKLDENHQKRKASSSKPASGNGNRFNQFGQNNYNFGELEQQLISNQ